MYVVLLRPCPDPGAIDSDRLTHLMMKVILDNLEGLAIVLSNEFFNLVYHAMSLYLLPMLQCVPLQTAPS